MNWKISSGVLIVASFSLAFSTCAQPTITLINKQTPKPVIKEAAAGILPTSFWYWSDIFAEELRFVFTLRAKNRADYLLEKAQERGAEMKELTMLGIATYNDELLKDKDRKVAHAQKIYEDIGETLNGDKTNLPTNGADIKNNQQDQSWLTQLTDKLSKMGSNIVDIFRNLFSK